MSSKTNLKTTFLPTLPIFSSTSSAQIDKGWGLRSVHPRLFLLRESLSPAPAWSPFRRRWFRTCQKWILPMGCNSSWTALWGAVFQEQAASTSVPHRVIIPTSTPAPVWALLFTILQIPARSLHQHGLPTGAQPFLGASSRSSVGSSRGCRHTAASPQAAGKFQLWRLNHLLPLLPLWPCFSYKHHFLSAITFPPLFLNKLRHYCHYPCDGLSLGQWGAVLGAVWIWLWQTQEELQLLPTEVSPVGPQPPPKPCHANPTHL